MRVAKIFQVAKELKFSVGIGFFQGFQEEPPEKRAEDSDWQQKPPTAADPTPAIGSKPAAGNHAVQVRMKVKMLPPGMQAREETQLHAPPIAPAPHSYQRFRPRPPI